ncbi:restriction endonuclease [Thioalkalivibrio nitratireducens]|uniref:restriction endonuclease n=1 Tax=Thioalkalivibrio nitratireducens TaxID=186931 RepID=UPI0009FA1FE8|nr:restriction endonuclease [Thioalkalivibrio nitratireducens]
MGQGAIDEKNVALLSASHNYVEGLKKIASDARLRAEKEGVFDSGDLALLDARWLIEKYRQLWFKSVNAERYIQEFCPNISLFGAHDFEKLIQVMFAVIDRRHFSLTPVSHDGGIDLTYSELVDPTWDAYGHIVIQCKLYRGIVPTSELRDFFGVMTSKTATGIFMTTGEITNAGREFVAEANSSPHANRYHVITSASFQQLFVILEAMVSNIEAAVDALDDEQEELRLAELNDDLESKGKAIIYRIEVSPCQQKLF